MAFSLRRPDRRRVPEIKFRRATTDNQTNRIRLPKTGGIMRLAVALSIAATLAIGSAVGAGTSPSEQDVINQYLKKTEKKHTRKLGWLSLDFGLNRINRDNDYNKFANYSSHYFSETSIPWLNQAKIFGIDAGVVLQERFSWSIGGEYWLKFGSDKPGTYTYQPPGAAPVETEIKSEIKVWGLTTGLDYYFYGHPTLGDKLQALALRAGIKLGYYQASWDLWPEYQNLNLATQEPAEENTTFKGSAPGLMVHVAADYPLGIWNLAFAADVGYMYLNFSNVAWYNSQDQEVVVTYAGTTDTRVDLQLSGIEGKIQLRRFFSW
jgi:hypothetical protein